MHVMIRCSWVLTVRLGRSDCCADRLTSFDIQRSNDGHLANAASFTRTVVNRACSRSRCGPELRALMCVSHL